MFQQHSSGRGGERRGGVSFLIVLFLWESGLDESQGAFGSLCVPGCFLKCCWANVCLGYCEVLGVHRFEVYKRGVESKQLGGGGRPKALNCRAFSVRKYVTGGLNRQRSGEWLMT